MDKDAKSAATINDSEIEINGEKRPLMDHIIKALTVDPDHLKNIDFIRYENGKYIIVAEDKPNLSEADLKQLGENNYVYASFYKVAKRDGRDYQNIGAIIIGTTDKKHANAIHFAALDAIMDKYKKQKDAKE